MSSGLLVNDEADQTTWLLTCMMTPFPVRHQKTRVWLDQEPSIARAQAAEVRRLANRSTRLFLSGGKIRTSRTPRWTPVSVSRISSRLDTSIISSLSVQQVQPVCTRGRELRTIEENRGPRIMTGSAVGAASQVKS
jgi:hypothetical protein